MRPCKQKLALSITRSLHTSSRVGVLPPSPRPSSPVRPAQRHFFHRTAAAHLPRRRTFFTSNVLLQQDGSERPANDTDGVGNGAKVSSGASGAGSVAAAASKRKPARAASVKNSLRRVAIIAQQPGGRIPGTAPASAPHAGEGESGGPGAARSSVAAAATSTGEYGAGGVSAAAVDGSGSSSSISSSTSIASASSISGTISAVCVAESFDMDLVVEILQAHGFDLDPDGTGFEAHEVVHVRGANGGDIFVFPSGTVVTWSLPADVVDGLATRRLLPAAEEPHVARREAEDLDFVADPGRDTSAMKGDVVVLGTRREEAEGDRLDTTLAKIAFSSGLARSTKLAVLESALTRYFESTRKIPALLERGSSRLAPPRRFILQKTGELLSLRAQLNHYSELTDSLPDIFWDSRAELGLEGYYDQVGKALDVGVRIRTLNQKMDYAQEIASVLREMSSERHSARLEWIIIVLITVEVLFELRRVYMERQAKRRHDVEDAVEKAYLAGEA